MTTKNLETPVTERSRRDAALQSWVEGYAQQLERQCRLAPYNWFNFYDFWQ